jgi:hypothetical protein
MSKSFTVTKAQARELKRISDRMARGGGGVSLEVVRRKMLEDMAVELRRMARAYGRTGRGARELLDALSLAEVEGVDAATLTAIRRELGERVRKRRAA